MSYEPCTTFARRKRHLAHQLTNSKYGPGRNGLTLCGAGGVDEAEANRSVGQWKPKPIEVALLPDCRKCVKRAEVLVREAGSTKDSTEDG